MTQKGRMQMDKVAEKLRFNALTQEQAKAHADKFEGQKFDLRSCWNCNGAHEHLKDRVVRCFACGVLYVGDIPAPILGARMRGEEVTDAMMDEYEHALLEAE